MIKVQLATVLCAFVAIQCSSSSSTPGAQENEAGASAGGSHGGQDASAGSSGSGQEAGSSDAGDASTGTPAGGAVDAKLVLDVPPSYHGAPRELDVVVVPQLPVAGPPAGILYQAKNPTIAAGQALTIHGDASGISGSNYVVVVLYMQGGGTFSPMPGVDYEAQSSMPAAFDGKPVDLGTMHLELVSADGGP
jgi:hypothetical protein